MQFHFEMFAFLSQFLDVHPEIYLIICCTTLVLWLHVAFINCDADQTNRLDVDSVHEKMQTLTFPNNSNHLGIPSIKGKKKRWIAFPHAFHANKILRVAAAPEGASTAATVPIECNRFCTNIETNFMEKFFTTMPLTWNGFVAQPTRMLFQNTGYDGNCMQMVKISVSFLSTLAVKRKIKLTHMHTSSEFPFDLRTASASFREEKWNV